MSNQSPIGHSKKRKCLRCHKEFRSEGNRICWQCHEVNKTVGKMGEYAPPSPPHEIIDTKALARKRKKKGENHSKDTIAWLLGIKNG